ncbi:hypothetical protein PFISCL1PPCAC_9824, partial [Pristionchus fissidentatus]
VFCSRQPASILPRFAGNARMATGAWSKYATWRFARKFVTGTALFYCVGNTIGSHLGELVICSGPSMHPTIQDGDLVIAERLSIRNGSVRVGDIVGCLNPHDHNQLLCKRLTAMERDRISPTTEHPLNRVPLGHIYLRGDNAAVSTDSRHFGPVPRGLLQIRLVLRVWPPSRAGWLSNHWWFEHEEKEL